MLTITRNSIMFVALAAIVPVLLVSPAIAGKHSCCCRICRCPTAQCVCPAPAAIPQTTYQGIYETHHAQQPVLQQRDALVTEYRTEPVVETVPTSVYENVLVDEGSYQTVWVPRLTSRAVARTAYETRTTYRTVPYHVSRRISEYAMQTVPYQTVRYVPTTAPSMAYGISSGYATAGYGYGSSFPTTIAGTAPSYGASVVQGPIVSASPSLPAPDPRFSAGTPSVVMPRSAPAEVRSMAVSPSYESRTAASGPALFSPAPSAAQVWRTPRSSVVR
jgi:hypothetical protein